MKRHSIRIPLLGFLLVCILFGFTGCTHTSSVSTPEKSSDVLRVGISANAPPLAFKKGGRLQGLEVDFANQLGKYLQKEIHFVELPWSKQIPSLEEGKIDIIMSGLTVTSQRSYRVAFSKPYLRSGQILLVRTNQARKYSSGIYSLMGNSPAIGVIENTTGDFFITQTINRPNLVKFKTSKAAVQSLLKEDIDVMVHDAPIVCHYAALNEGKVTPILQMATEEYLAWAVNTMNADLLTRVNEFIETKNNQGEIKATVKRWIPYM